MNKKASLRRLTWTLLWLMVVLSFSVVCKKKMDEAKKHFDLGVQYESQQMVPDAIAEFRKAIQISPDYTDALFQLGSLYHLTKAYSSAIEEYEKVLRINPNYPKIHTAIANVHYERGIKAWTRAVRLNQWDFWEPDTLRQLPAKNKAELVKLIEVYLEKVKADSTDAATFSNLSQACFVLAVDEYQKAVQANPLDTTAQLFLGLSYSEQGYPYKAMARSEVLKNIDPRQANVVIGTLKQKEEEKEYLGKLRKQAPR
ncbi:MAG: tetratricopeptide repeat protein [Candidatus Zixiibacteriota bacterium]